MRRLPFLMLLAAATTLTVLYPTADLLFGYHDGNIMAGKVAVCHYTGDYTTEWGATYHVYNCHGVFTFWQIRKLLYRCASDVYYAVGLGDRAMYFVSCQGTGCVWPEGDVLKIDDDVLYGMYNITVLGGWAERSKYPKPPVPRELSLFEWCFVP